MASTIACLILLLVTYAYSAPIEPEYVKLTTEKSLVERGNSVKMDLTIDDEFTSTSIMHQERSSSTESDSDEVTSHGVTSTTDKNEDWTHPSSSTYEYSSSTEKADKRGVDDDLFTTTWESSTEFNRRAIRPTDNKEILESSTHDSIQEQKELNKDIESSSSVDTFARVTGLLKNESTSTTPDNETTEEPEIKSPIKSERITKTISVIPGKITETKIYANIPSKTTVIIKPIEDNQLSQGSTLLLFLLAALLYCIFLMASTIAIVKSTLSMKRRSRITEMEADLDKHLLR